MTEQRSTVIAQGESHALWTSLAHWGPHPHHSVTVVCDRSRIMACSPVPTTQVDIETCAAEVAELVGETGERKRAKHEDQRSHAT
jgi:hypothetical protein